MNKVMVITGSSSGIGAFTAIEAAKRGYNVVITYLTHEADAQELEKFLKEKYRVDTLCLRCDISNENNIHYLFDKVIEKFNRVDVLVNNAGIAIDNDFNTKTKNDFMKILEVNLVGTFLVSRLFGNYMKEHDGGKIINISSNNGIDAFNSYSLDYDASKAGIINLSHNLAHELAPLVKVNTICPGWTNTVAVKEMNPNIIKEETDKILLGRFAEPKEISDVICFLASDASSYINDSVIRVDGGIK